MPFYDSMASDCRKTANSMEMPIINLGGGGV